MATPFPEEGGGPAAACVRTRRDAVAHARRLRAPDALHVARAPQLRRSGARGRQCHGLRTQGERLRACSLFRNSAASFRTCTIHFARHAYARIFVAAGGGGRGPAAAVALWHPARARDAPTTGTIQSFIARVCRLCRSIVTTRSFAMRCGGAAPASQRPHRAPPHRARVPAALTARSASATARRARRRRIRTMYPRYTRCAPRPRSSRLRPPPGARRSSTQSRDLHDLCRRKSPRLAAPPGSLHARRDACARPPSSLRAAAPTVAQRGRPDAPFSACIVFRSSIIAAARTMTACRSLRRRRAVCSQAAAAATHAQQQRLAGSSSAMRENLDLAGRQLFIHPLQRKQPHASAGRSAQDAARTRAQPGGGVNAPRRAAPRVSAHRFGVLRTRGCTTPMRTSSGNGSRFCSCEPTTSPPCGTALQHRVHATCDQ